ncbi:MAG: glycerol-3-phosphate 1-O-acyltransferase PlsY, partial [Candidatus Aminicenantes bacterium]|nr:glycerol-3-phosphate 1-O-acyltransferase PlsY [Candidatus Aminicenantes bacterium]
QEGSGNIGTTNVLRAKGKKAAAATLLCDMLKGALPIIYGMSNFESPVVIACGGAAAVIGHLFPVYLKFKGGKGVASLVGMFLVFNSPAAIVFFVSFFVLLALTHYVSAASITGVTAAFFYTLFTDIAEVSLIVFMVVILILIKHGANINRLMAGTEDKLNWKKNG